MGLNTSKYGVSRDAGIGGLWRTATSAPAEIMDDLHEWSDVLKYGGVIVIGGFILMIGYSFMSGKQSISATMSAAGSLAKSGAKFTPMGRAASLVGAI